MKKCNKCGTIERNDNTSICSVCGGDLSQAEIINEPAGACWFCGKPMRPGAAFCNSCGKPIAPPNYSSRARSVARKKNNNGVLIVLIIVLLLLFCAVVSFGTMYFMDKRNSEDVTSAITEKSDKKEKADKEVPENKFYYVSNCEESITLRKAPSTGAEEIMQMPLGALVEYIESAENGYYKVNYAGLEGYAHSSYLSVEKPVPSPNEDNLNAEAKNKKEEKKKTEEKPENTTVIATYYVVNCEESITLRKTSSVYGTEITQIPLGASVGYIESAENGYYKVNYNGKIGYALSSYLSKSATGQESLSYTTGKVVDCDVSITLRETPSVYGDEIMQIPLGDYVTYIEKAENGFYCVEYNGYRGFVMGSYIKLY